MVRHKKTQEQVRRVFVHCFRHLKRMGYKQRLTAFGLYPLAGTWGHRGALLWIGGNDKLRGNRKTIAREHVATSSRSASFAILVVNAWNKLPEDVVEA